jgi:SAM-dependent methyltransferase
MHITAMINSKLFFDVYSKKFINQSNVTVVEIGSQDVNGSLRENCPEQFNYVGVDFVAGKGVDVILEDPYVLPFESNSADIILSSSCFEHSELFWLLFLEIMRVLKEDGLFYLNVPSNGEFHRWPVDCWRFYPDSGNALVSWGKRNGLDLALLESYTSLQIGDQWNDFVAVFLKDKKYAPQYPEKILDSKADIYNGRCFGVEEFVHYSTEPEDKKKLLTIGKIVSNEIKIR